MQRVVVVYIILSLAAIVILSVLLATKKNCKEGFSKCVCNSREGGREEVCQNIELVQQLYDGSVLTENSNLKAPGWERGASPGALTFPDDQGCSTGCDSEVKENTPHKWQYWDYTMFGSNPSCG